MSSTDDLTCAWLFMLTRKIKRDQFRSCQRPNESSILAYTYEETCLNLLVRSANFKLRTEGVYVAIDNKEKYILSIVIINNQYSMLIDYFYYSLYES